MAWTYADWESQSGDSARLDRLRLHIAEVAQLVGPEVAGGGMSKGSSSLTNYLRDLRSEATRLQARVERAASGVVLARMRRDFRR